MKQKKDRIQGFKDLSGQGENLLLRLTKESLLKGSQYLVLLVLFCVIPFSGCLDHGLGPTGLSEADTLTGFSGTVSFVGGWPDDSKECRLVIYRDYPRTVIDVMNPANWDSIPLFVDSFDYFMPMEPDSYEIVFVAFLTEGGMWGLNSVAGVYYEQSDSSWPAGVLVKEGEITEGIDILVDFDNIPIPVPVPEKEHLSAVLPLTEAKRSKR